MAAAPTDALMDDLRRYCLLEPAQFDEIARIRSGGPAEPKALADDLVRRGWLTSYQADQLLKGRGKDLVLGSYILLESLGEGGMSQVFKARQQKLGRIVALKVLRKERQSNTETVHRFQRELRALASLSHPNIVTAYSADEVRGAHMLVMEYIEGATDLAALVKKNGPLPIHEACDYVRQAALGLQHAHERGLVHRDVKPHNLLLCAGGKVVKILDLGLARLDAPDGEASAITKDGAILGSPDYLSPEQAQNMHSVDIRADLYSLGCTFYFLLAGQPPFPGGTFFDKVYRHRFEEPEALETLRPDAPPAVVAVVRKLMAKRPEDRFGTPGEVASAVAALLHAGAEPAAAAGVCTAPNQEPAADSALAHTAGHSDTAAEVPSYRRRRKPTWDRWLMYAVSAGLCVLIGAIALLLLIRFLPTPPKPAKPPEHDNPAPVVETPPTKLPTEVFQDFESGKYDPRKTTGTAFGAAPVLAAKRLPGQQPVAGYGGKYYVSSFVGGDKSVGTLTSPEFTIRHSYIRFRIGGGDMLDKEYIALLVGDGDSKQKMRTATGKNTEKLEWDGWDVRDLKGQKAIIEIVDNATNAWGHIDIDDIIFTDDPPP